MKTRHGEAGVTLLELIVVLAILSLSVTAVALNLEPLGTPLQAGASLVESFMREARLNAIATTSAYRVKPTASDRLGAETADSCDASTWTTDPSMRINLPKDVDLSSTSWSVCFTSRGISTDNIKIQLLHDLYGSAGIEVMLGGTTRVVQ
jgi:prepilin-type N-terminal cleavage/methylation domain-containing protein